MSEARHKNHSTAAGQRLLWLAALGLVIGLTALFWALERPGRGGIVMQAGGEQAMVVIRADRSGHYVARGEINGEPVRFLVDTGATDVALSESQARSLGLEFGPRIALSTAGGPSTGWMTRIDEVRIGGLRRRDVRATITSAPMDSVLLGMSFLRHYRLEQDGDELVIARREGAPS